MIVDVHTHCMQPDHVTRKSREAEERAGYAPMKTLAPETYLEAMAPADRTIVFGIRALSHGIATSNDYTAE